MSQLAGRLRQRLGVHVPLMLLVACTALSGCASKTASAAGDGNAAAPASAGPSTAKPGGAGTTVAIFSGDENARDTDPFTLHGGKVRFVYTVQPNDVGPVPFKWSMFDKGAPANPASPRASNACVSCDGQQTNDLGAVPAGSYYLHILTSRPWTLTVVEG